MTNTDNRQSAASRDRARLVVPRGHRTNSAQIKSSVLTPVFTSTPKASLQPPKVILNTKTLASQSRITGRKVVKPYAATHEVNRTGRTIRPVAMTEPAVQTSVNDNEIITKTVNPAEMSAKYQQVKPAEVKIAKNTMSTGAPKVTLDKEKIMKQAAQIRAKAKVEAEAKARADLLKHLEVAKKTTLATSKQTESNPLTSHKTVRPVVAANIKQSVPVSNPRISLSGSSQAGVITFTQPDIISKLANLKVSFSFKINKQRVFNFIRYLAIVVIVAASGYLAWDTYITNQAVKNTFNGDGSATAMSIAGANPMTADQTTVSREDKAAYTVPADQPRYINIPSIGVNARVFSVGVNSKGNIDTPANLNDTAWYDGSAKPGQPGQVFVDGHTSFSSTISAAFNDLPKLKQDDLITIEKGNGDIINYRVVEVETVDADKVDMGKALNPPTGATKGLTLMTCTGTFDYKAQTADKRLVVYAIQENE